MDADTRRILDTAFPEYSVRSVELLDDSGHPGNKTMCIQFESGSRCFLKIRTDGNSERNAREAAVTEYVRQHATVRAPQVVASDSTHDPPYLATAPLEGDPMQTVWTNAPTEEQIALAREVGRTVAGVSVIEFGDPGWIIGGDETGLDCVTGSWSDVLADAIESRAMEIGCPDRFRTIPTRVATLLRENRGILDGAESTLIHADIQPANIFLDGQSGLIDWEWSLVGDPGLMLCWVEGRLVEQADVQDSDQDLLRTAIRNGYRDVHADLPAKLDQRRALYQVVTFLPKLLTFEAWAPETQEPIEDLADWVRSELETRIATAETRTA